MECAYCFSCPNCIHAHQPNEYKAEERCALAVKSRLAPPKFGTPERQKLINEIHGYMLSKAESKVPPVPKQEEHKINNGDVHATSFPQIFEASPSGDSEIESGSNLQLYEAATNNVVTEVSPALEELVEPVNIGNTHSMAETSSAPAHSVNSLRHAQGMKTQKPVSDWLFTWAAVGLTVALVVLLLKKFLQSCQHGTVFMDGS